MTRGAKTTGTGVPLALLALMVGAWVSARAAVWDNPIEPSAPALAVSEELSGSRAASAQSASAAGQSFPAPQSLAYPHAYGPGQLASPAGYGGYPYPYYGYPPHYAVNAAQDYGRMPPRPIVYYPVYADAPYPSGHYQSADAAAYSRLSGSGLSGPRHAGPPQGGRFALAPELRSQAQRFLPQTYALDDITGFAWQDLRRTGQVSRPGSGSGLPSDAPQKTDRWLLDSFGFYRQGSSALSIPQGRSPIYGASQISANLQWRAKPSSSRDPRIFLRAYQAQVEGGESEIAAGLSARPFGKLPVRLFGELRATQSPAISDQGIGVQTQFRPAAYAATEFAPFKLPMGFSLETYGAAGYVAGRPSTYFLDGQAVATRELLRIGRPGAGGTVSIGGGVWGGAQRDARRLDVGPTLRFDVDIGKMPARVSVDYREQVAGDAEPDSGVAATVSTRF